MYRKLMALLCVLGLLAVCFAPSGQAVGRSVPAQADGTLLAGTSYLDDGVTYVPLRSLLDAFGGWSLRWDAQTQTATAVSGSGSLQADPGQNRLRVGSRSLSGKVWVENGRTYVPLRLLTEALGGSVAWDRWLGGAAIRSPGAEFDPSDLYWLSRIISAESRGESLEGQIAVGNVVLNRVESTAFPDSVPAVIFDARDAIQFEPVSNGTLWLAPTAQSVEAARQVLRGVNTAGAALYFYAPALSQGLWINANRTYSKTIGCHRFYL